MRKCDRIGTTSLTANRRSCASVLRSLIGVCALWIAIPGHAAVLNWDTVTWTDGALTNSYDVDGDGKLDVKVTITGDTSAFYQAPGLWDAARAGSDPGAPSSAGTGGKLLTLWMDQSSSSNTVTVTVTFLGNYAGGVYTSFQLHDIDQGGYQDQVSSIDGLQAGAADKKKNWNVNPVSVTGGDTAVVAGSGNNLTITGYGAANNNSSAGDANIDFGNTKVSGFEFTYGNGPDAPANPGLQHIQLGDITFSTTATPEVHPGLAGAVLCLLMMGFSFVRSRRQLFA